MPVETINHHIEITDVAKYIAEKNASCYRVTTCKINEETTYPYYNRSYKCYTLHLVFSSCSKRYEENLQLYTLDPTIPAPDHPSKTDERFKRVSSVDPTGETKYYVLWDQLLKTSDVRDNKYVEMPGL